MLDRVDVEKIRQAMPATLAHIYLNTGTFGPMPACVLSAMEERLRTEYTEGRIGPASFSSMADIYKDARCRVARLLHAEESEVALTDNTGEGMNIVSYGFDWHEGDEIITTNHEHISALAPLYQLRDRYGIVIRVADLGLTAAAPALDAMRELHTARTRLLVVSHVTWTTGARLALREMSDWAHAKGIPILVDGAQSAGAIPIDVKELNVDFYAIPMQKWLCGPDGTGALYAHTGSLDYITPTYVGYWSIKHEEDVEWELHEHAQRFEVGGRQSAAVAGQAAGLQWLEETIDFARIYERIAALHRYAYEALASVPDLTILTPQPGASGLLTFTLADRNVDQLVSELRERRHILVRTIASLHAVRIATGFYNTEAEIDTLVHALQQM